MMNQETDQQRFQKIITAIRESGYDHDFIELAKSVSQDSQQGELDYCVLTEACGLVIAEELGMVVPQSFVVTKDGYSQNYETGSDYFLAALKEARNLRYQNQNDLFKLIIVFSSFHDALCQYAEDNPQDKDLSSLKGSTFHFSIEL